MGECKRLNRTPTLMLLNAERQMLGPQYAERGSGGLWFVHGGIACLCAGTEQQMRAEVERPSCLQHHSRPYPRRLLRDAEW